MLFTQTLLASLRDAMTLRKGLRAVVFAALGSTTGKSLSSLPGWESTPIWRMPPNSLIARPVQWLSTFPAACEQG